jgi:hypothetical protein
MKAFHTEIFPTAIFSHGGFTLQRSFPTSIVPQNGRSHSGLYPQRSFPTEISHIELRSVRAAILMTNDQWQEIRNRQTKTNCSLPFNMSYSADDESDNFF